ncbi:histone-lysine N-methyltransferase SUV39H2-like [Uloborus diversus]|uniref:histone-lysine N-methyltransferase SUV39H2-like n=1 Tax=Uloborus diversus TaxID=327109 RepID=UPI00240A2D58|nr:histone-lysine N-methyltransferase SUV39H2-like [Uloborus diversus]
MYELRGPHVVCGHFKTSVSSGESPNAPLPNVIENLKSLVRKLKSFNSDNEASLDGDEDFNREKCFRSEVSSISENYECNGLLDDYTEVEIQASTPSKSDSSDLKTLETDIKLEISNISECNNELSYFVQDVKSLLFPSINLRNTVESCESLDEPTSPLDDIKEKTNQEKVLKVACLQSIDDLERVSQERGLRMIKDFITNDASSFRKRRRIGNTDSTHQESENQSENGSEDSDSEDLTNYEVDMIVDDKIEEGEILYLVKWMSYHSRRNTWEPEYHLTGCKELVNYYDAMKDSNTKLNRKLLTFFINEITSRKPTDILTLTKLCALFSKQTEEFVNSLKLTSRQLKEKVKEVLEYSSNKLQKISVGLLELMRFYEKRKWVLLTTQEWEEEINSNVDPSSYIKVENNVDLEFPPFEFKFISDYTSTSATLNQDPVAFCKCTDCLENQDDCCPNDSEGYFAYNKNRRLKLQPGYPIFECNKFCSCDHTCINRVVQYGSKIKFSIFKTANGCGWGLKTLQAIEKGEFVLEYIGEIITSEDAEARGYIYDYVGRSYLFDLDYGTENCAYTVDAGHVGNAAHFINHSCDPNLHVFAVWINNPDPNLPRLAFFARRRIKRFEELTFDYKMVNNREKSWKIMEDSLLEDPSSSLSEEGVSRIECKCNSRNCRKYLF